MTIHQMVVGKDHYSETRISTMLSSRDMEMKKLGRMICHKERIDYWVICYNSQWDKSSNDKIWRLLDMRLDPPVLTIRNGFDEIVKEFKGLHINEVGYIYGIRTYQIKFKR